MKLIQLIRLIFLFETLSATNVEMQELVNLFTSLQSDLNITCECLKGEINKTTEEKLQNSK